MSVRDDCVAVGKYCAMCREYILSNTYSLGIWDTSWFVRDMSVRDDCVAVGKYCAMCREYILSNTYSLGVWDTSWFVRDMSVRDDCVAVSDYCQMCREHILSNTYSLDIWDSSWLLCDMSVREDCLVVHDYRQMCGEYILSDTYSLSMWDSSWVLCGVVVRRSCIAVGNYCVLHVWMLHVTWRANESRHIWMRVLMSRMRMFESCQTCETPHSDAQGALNTSSQIWMHHVIYERVIPQVNASCYMRKSHGTYEWDMAHIDEWYRIWMHYIT